MITMFGLEDANPVRNPMVLGQDLLPGDDNNALGNKTKYRELVGFLLYVANATRPRRIGRALVPVAVPRLPALHALACSQASFVLPEGYTESWYSVHEREGERG